MNYRRCLYAGALVVTLVIGLRLWKPLHVEAAPGTLRKWPDGPRMAVAVEATASLAMVTRGIHEQPVVVPGK